MIKSKTDFTEKTYVILYSKQKVKLKKDKRDKNCNVRR